MTNYIPLLTVGNLAIAAGGFLVGHYGIPATWAALKSIYFKIRSEFSAAKAVTPVSTVQTPVVTPVTTVGSVVPAA